MPELGLSAAAAKKDGEPEDKNGKKPEEKEGCDNKGATDKEQDEGDEQDGAEGKKGKKAEDDVPEGKSGKKAAATVTLTAGEPLQAMRAESDIQAIAALCKMAGKPEMAAEFLMKKNSKGEYMSVAEVSEALTASRVAESEGHMINSHVNPNAGSGGVQELEAQAQSFARQNRGQVTPALYVSGATVRMTKERAYAAMLEENPQAYEQFRNRHNAAAIIRTLENAGVRVR